MSEQRKSNNNQKRTNYDNRKAAGALLAVALAGGGFALGRNTTPQHVAVGAESHTSRSLDEKNKTINKIDNNLSKIAKAFDAQARKAALEGVKDVTSSVTLVDRVGGTNMSQIDISDRIGYDNDSVMSSHLGFSIKYDPKTFNVEEMNLNESSEFYEIDNDGKLKHDSSGVRIYDRATPTAGTFMEMHKTPYGDWDALDNSSNGLGHLNTSHSKQLDSIAQLPSVVANEVDKYLGH